jgi:hypothetical protein
MAKKKSAVPGKRSRRAVPKKKVADPAEVLEVPKPAEDSAAAEPEEQSDPPRAQETDFRPEVLYKPVGTDPESLRAAAGYPDDLVLIGVMVSWNYHGELSVVLPRAMQVLDRLIVVTDVDDHRTREMVRGSGADLMLTRNFRRNGATFNKSEAVHIAQRRAHSLCPGGWVLLFDSDIVLPENLREMVAEEAVDDLALYGMERLDFYSPEAYAAREPDDTYKHRAAGYFQLYRRKDFLYQPFSFKASKCDISFMRKFPRVKMLSGFCEHLGRKAVNWDGRVAPEWRQADSGDSDGQ